jgi:hypothetical protein
MNQFPPVDATMEHIAQLTQTDRWLKGKNAICQSHVLSNLTEKSSNWPGELVGQDFLDFIRFLDLDRNPDGVNRRLDVAPLILTPRYHDRIQEQLLAHSIVGRLDVCRYLRTSIARYGTSEDRKTIPKVFER